MSNAVNPVKPNLSGLYAKTNGEELAFPLKHTHVKAKIAGNVSRVEVTQTFENQFTKPLEAVYVFPLPDEAAVDDMEIKIGDRIIKGSVKKREEAQEIYEQAKKQGRTAGLLEQERDNIFTQSLANILPGEQIDVTIRYTDSLKFEGGNYEFIFPMVVGTRYIPGQQIDDSRDTDQVPDASRITPDVIPPDMRSGHDINVTVEIDAGLPIKSVNSPSHKLEVEREGQTVRVKLSESDTIPNKDLILRYQIAAEKPQSTVLTQADSRGGHFAIYLIPALEYSKEEIVPKDMIFLVDSSGSQMGEPIQQCQELMRRFINGLNPNDTFTIFDFSDRVRKLSSTPLENTSENRAKAINYINNIKAGGATEMLGGICSALNVPASKGRLRSIVLLTDGYIGNENEILGEVQKKLKPGNRLHSFGAGSSVNRFLINRIAEVGRGISTIIRHDEPTEKVVEKFFRKINNPVLTNIEVDCKCDGEAPVIYPGILPDLFAEQPLVIFGRKQDRNSVVFNIKGVTASEKAYENTFRLDFQETGNFGIAQLWGRAKIKDLMNQMFSYETKSGVEAVTETALNYQLLSQYTAFVAVSEEVRVTPEGESITVQVPVEMPEGVSRQRIFGDPEEKVRGAAMGGMMMLSALPSPAPQASYFPERTRGLAKAASPQTVPDYEEDSFDSLWDALPTKESDEPQASNCNLKIISATGEQALIDSLTQYLQQQNFSCESKGEIVLEMIVNKGRVGRIMLDEDASTLKDATLIDLIKKYLIKWPAPKSASGTVSITLQVEL
jgi:Ca-activated chloride channel homolog